MFKKTTRRALLWTTATALVFLMACGTDVSLFGPEQGSSSVAASGGSGGAAQGTGGSTVGPTTSVGGQGGQAECVDASDCTAEICSAPTCEAGQCGSKPVDYGEPCGSDPDAACDGMGACLLVNGSACSAAAECLSGFCADGVCCEKACDGECEGCAQDGTVGQCTLLDAATDPDMECAPDGVCDGAGRCASGTIELGSSFGESFSQYIYAVKTDSSSNVIVAGLFFGDVSLGGDNFTNDGAFDFFVAKFDKDGKHLFSKRLARSGNNYAPVLRLAIGKDDRIIMSGSYTGSIDFNGDVVEASGYDIFTVSYDKTGNFLWYKVYGGPGDQRAYDVASDADGNIFLGGRFAGSLNFDGKQLNANGYDGFLAKLDLDGVVKWAKGYGAGQNQYIRAVAADGQGNLFASGYFYGAIDFGLGTMTAASNTADAFVVKFDTDGMPLAEFKTDGTGYESVRQISVDTQGRPAVSGVFSNTLTFGNAMYTAAENYDHHVLVFDEQLKPRWSKQLMGRTEYWARTVLSHDQTGSLLVGREFDGTIDDNGMKLQADGLDALVTKYSEEGTYLWSQVITGDSTEELRDLSVAPDGATWVVGHFQGDIDFGKGEVESKGNQDAFMLKYSP